jgi:hypothetical protein
MREGLLPLPRDAVSWKSGGYAGELEHCGSEVLEVWARPGVPPAILPAPLGGREVRSAGEANRVSALSPLPAG